MRAAIKAQNALGRGRRLLENSSNIIQCGFNVALVTNYSGTLRRMEDSLTIWDKHPPKNKEKGFFFKDNCKEVCQ